MFKLEGKIVAIMPTQVVSEKFSKREFVVETPDQYPQQILFQLTQDKCSLLDSLQVGQEVDVHLNIRGRSWQNPQGETKYFNTLEAWKIDVLGATAQPHIADDLDEMFKR
jgi:single-strand DNA-binding protein